MYVLGGRTLLVHLDVGETLQLHVDDDITGMIWHTTFCVSLATQDMV